jgi:hypothetical protein
MESETHALWIVDDPFMTFVTAEWISRMLKINMINRIKQKLSFG